MFKHECVECTQQKTISLKENSAQLLFHNNDEVCIRKVKVDDCQITEGKRCDYLLLSDAHEFFIELKGHHYTEALKQLGASIKALGRQKCKRRFALLICNRVPNISQVNQAKFIRNSRATLITKSPKLEFNYPKDLDKYILSTKTKK